MAGECPVDDKMPCTNTRTEGNRRRPIWLSRIRALSDTKEKVLGDKGYEGGELWAV